MKSTFLFLFLYFVCVGASIRVWRRKKPTSDVCLADDDSLRPLHSSPCSRGDARWNYVNVSAKLEEWISNIKGNSFKLTIRHHFRTLS